MEFKGVKYVLCDNWIPYIQLPNDNTPITYCEIGVFYGANLLRFAELYGKHPQSKLIGIDPWIEYNEYSEYKNEISNIYKTFCENLEGSPHKDKITIYRDFSEKILPTLENNYFDIIYIDGNHETEYVVKDAEMAYKLLKVGGYIIFDDINWHTVREGYFIFMKKYIDGKVKFVGESLSQAIITKEN